MISCGHCGNSHETLAEVKDCSVVNSLARTALDAEKLSEEQRELLLQVAAGLNGPYSAEGESAPEGFYRVPVRIKLEMVEWHNQSGEPSHCAKCQVELPDEYKVYFEFGWRVGGEARCKEHEYKELVKDEFQYYKVQMNLQGNRAYAKRLTARYGSSGDADSITGFGWEYVAGAVRILRPEHLLSEEQAAEFGKLYGYCCICGRRLTDETSIARGIGPVCLENMGW